MKIQSTKQCRFLAVPFAERGCRVPVLFLLLVGLAGWVAARARGEQMTMQVVASLGLSQPSLVEGDDWNLYCAGNSDAIVRVSPQGVATVVSRVPSVLNLRWRPGVTLVRGSDGQIYGTTSYLEGTIYGGTVFRLESNSVVHTLFSSLFTLEQTA